MKKLMIGLFILLSIKSNAQFFGEQDKVVISKDTTLIDTIKCKFYITDTTRAGGDEASVVYFVNGYKVVKRKGEMSLHIEQAECPEHRLGCGVYHTRTGTKYPPVISVYYLRKDKARIKQKRWDIHEINEYTIFEN